MASVVEIRLPAGEICLEETIEKTSVRFSALQSVAYNGTNQLPFIRAAGDEVDIEDVDELLAADSTVERLACIASAADGRLYRIWWVDGVDVAIERLLGNGGVVLEARTTADEWWFRLLYPDRKTLSRMYERCSDWGISISIDRIYEFDGHQRQSCSLTAQQYETISAAHEHGYYDVPRNVTLTELAEAIGISHQALSERLRRGHNSLIEHTIVADTSGTAINAEITDLVFGHKPTDSESDTDSGARG